MIKLFREVLPFWNLLTLEDRQLIEKRYSEHNYKKGDMVYNTLKFSPGLKIVKSGRIRISMPVVYGDILLYRFEKRHFCILSVFDQMEQFSWDIHVEAETETEIVSIPSSVYQKICERNVAMKEYSHKVLIERMSEIIEIISNMAMANTEQRIAWLLLHMWKETGHTQIHLTHELVAKDVGTAREVVSRTLKQFEADETVKVHRGMIEILDVEKLKSVYGGQY